ncbi:hypothetical protein SAY87_021182 [Trapa incisa]|uniref:Ubiquitin-like domain-containing protein n=1 Tax=Trapa incisa TaxID=236973 RepID=A0AAN7JRK3_9MYRT|nr:hypothetical protein SAY87_021182 [Trapa incisa]
MRLTVEIFTGPLFHVEVDDGGKVSDLKKEIAAQAELPYERLILVLDVPAGDDGSERRLIEEAKDGAPLADVGAYDGAHMYIFLKPLDPADEDGSGYSNPFSDGNHDQAMLLATIRGELGIPPFELK